MNMKKIGALIIGAVVVATSMFTALPAANAEAAAKSAAADNKILGKTMLPGVRADLRTKEQKELFRGWTCCVMIVMLAIGLCTFINTDFELVILL